MLHEIILALIGFVGDIIIEQNNNFVVKPDFDLLTTAEIEQVNRIVPLGWHYNDIKKFVSKYDINWGGLPLESKYNNRLFHTYHAGLASGAIFSNSFTHSLTHSLIYLFSRNQ